MTERKLPVILFLASFSLHGFTQLFSAGSILTIHPLGEPGIFPSRFYHSFLCCTHLVPLPPLNHTQVCIHRPILPLPFLELSCLSHQTTPTLLLSSPVNEGITSQADRILPAQSAGQEYRCTQKSGVQWGGHCHHRCCCCSHCCYWSHWCWW